MAIPVSAKIILPIFIITIFLQGCTEKSSQAYNKWEEYLGGPGRKPLFISYTDQPG